MKPENILNFSKAVGPLLHITETLKKREAWDFVLKMSCHRLWNNLYYNRNKVPVFPLDIYMELTNHCNLNCIMCARKEMVRPRGFMTFETLKEVIDQIPKGWKTLVRLHDWGEPLLHPEFLKLARYARTRAWLLELVTNGQLLTGSLAEGIMELNIDRLVVSIDGTTKETYEKVRRGGSYEVISENMSNFITLRKMMKKNKPLIQISTIVIEETRKEIKNFSKVWKDYCDVIRITPVTLASYQKVFNADTESLPHERRTPCIKLWNEMTILWNGDVPLCCGDFNRRTVLGNVKEDSLMDIWHNNALNSIRKMHKSREFSGLVTCVYCPAERTIWGRAPR